MNYSLFRSRTFWTLVATAVVSVGNIFLPIIPVAAQGLVTVVLLVIASYFHLQTGQSTSGIN